MTRRIAPFSVLLSALVALTGCAVQQVPFLDYATIRGVALPAPPPDKAQVLFFLWVARPGENLVVLDGDDTLAIVRYLTWTSALVDPGEHRFGIVSLENADFTVGDLEGGKTYLLEAQDIFPTYRFRLQPVTPETSNAGLTVRQALPGLYHVQRNAKTSAWLEAQRPRVIDLRDRYLEKWLTKPVRDRRTIPRDSGIEGPLRYLPPATD